MRVRILRQGVDLRINVDARLARRRGERRVRPPREDDAMRLILNHPNNKSWSYRRPRPRHNFVCVSLVTLVSARSRASALRAAAGASSVDGRP